MEKRCVVITHEQLSLGDIEPIAAILESGCWRVHIRKPNADKDKLRSYLDVLCKRVDVKRLSMHYYHDIALEYGFGGLHGATTEDGMIKSISCHSLEEVKESQVVVDYLFISPVFDSISKQGYKAAIDIEKVGEIINKGVKSEIVALGGIEKSNLPILEKAGFRAVALLGAVWRDGDKKAPDNLKDIIKKWR